MKNSNSWWKTGIIYQIYPRSFQDTNGDGIGDIQGIIKRLSYLKSLGIKAIWLSPIFYSPMHDFGYDISDYKKISPLFGTMKDFERLLDETHKLDLKLILDLVPNHTSIEHEWFKESKSSKNNPKRNWYIWRDPKPGNKPPTNWMSFFGGPAWSYDKKTKQYYLHLFSKEQPDLNYRTPEVRQVMLNIMKFWLDKGIDGFRVDSICSIFKDDKFRNEPKNSEWDGKLSFMKYKRIHTSDLPETHEYIREMRTLTDKYKDVILIGEAYLNCKKLIKYYGKNNDECHLPFYFQLLEVQWKAEVIKRYVDEYEKLIPINCWPNYVLGNHDQKRIVSRIGKEQAKLAAMLLLTLRGTPTIYYGDELGMHDVIPNFVLDPPAINQPELINEVCRDPARTPMQWDCSPNAGFTERENTPWLPVANDSKINNVEKEENNPDSMLNLFKKLIKLRNSEEALLIGNYTPIKTNNDNIFSYTRSYNSKAVFLIILNFSDKEQFLDMGKRLKQKNAVSVLSTVNSEKNISIDLSNIIMVKNEGKIIKLF